MGGVEELIALARAVSGGPDPSEALQRIDDALVEHTDVVDRGRLQLARSIALQCSPDPRDAADAMLDAARTLRQTGARATHAYAASAGAVMFHRTGDIDRSVSLMVEALIQLDTADPTAVDALSASNALAQQFAAMSSFDRAAELAQRTFLQSTELPPIVRAHYAISMGYCAISALRADDTPEAQHDDAHARAVLSAASWLETNTTVPSDALIAAAYRGEVALVLDDESISSGVGARLDIERADDHDHYEGMGLRLIAYHRLVRAECAARWGSSGVARTLLDRCIPELEQLGDELRLVRAFEARIERRRTDGDLAGAADDALALAKHALQWRANQDQGLAAQVAERAELELARARLLGDADRLAREASIDELTGVGNRRWLELRIDEVSRSATETAVLMVDLDHFKTINDEHGHLTGDAILRTVGEILGRTVRRSDVVARYGGDEFIVLLEDVDLETSSALATRVHERLSADGLGMVDVDRDISVSIGLAQGPAANVRDLVRLADGALYEAKAAGRNQIRISPSSHPPG